MSLTLPFGVYFGSPTFSESNPAPANYVAAVASYNATDGHGWAQNFVGGVFTRDASADARFCGGAYIQNTAESPNGKIYRFDTGPANIKFFPALGDIAAARPHNRLEIYDGGSSTPGWVIHDVGPGTADRWADAQGTEFVSRSAFLAGEQPLEITITSTYMLVKMGSTSLADFTVVASMRLEAGVATGTIDGGGPIPVVPTKLLLRHQAHGAFL